MKKRIAALFIMFMLLLSLMPAVYAADITTETQGNENNTVGSYLNLPLFLLPFLTPHNTTPVVCPPSELPPCIPPPCILPPCIPPPCLFGSLTVTKTLSAPAGFDMSKQFEFTLRNEANCIVATATLGNGGSATFNCLKLGTYTITESDAAVADYNLDVTVSGAATVNGGTLTITEGSQTVAFTNTYVKQTGDLTITKTLCAPCFFNPCKQFTFTVRDSVGNVVATAVLKGGESTTIYGLEVGTYTVTESDASVCGYCLTVEVSGAATANGGSLTIVQGTQEVNFKNIYKYKIVPFCGIKVPCNPSNPQPPSP